MLFTREVASSEELGRYARPDELGPGLRYVAHCPEPDAALEGRSFGQSPDPRTPGGGCLDVVGMGVAGVMVQVGGLVGMAATQGE
jgi:hypothetical protein